MGGLQRSKRVQCNKYHRYSASLRSCTAVNPVFIDRNDHRPSKPPVHGLQASAQPCPLYRYSSWPQGARANVYRALGLEELMRGMAHKGGDNLHGSGTKEVEEQQQLQQQANEASRTGPGGSATAEDPRQSDLPKGERAAAAKPRSRPASGRPRSGRRGGNSGGGGGGKAARVHSPLPPAGDDGEEEEGGEDGEHEGHGSGGCVRLMVQAPREGERKAPM